MSVDEGACELLLFPIFLCLKNSIVFRENFPIFCAHGWRKMFVGLGENVTFMIDCRF